MGAILRIARKDLRQRLRDRSAYIVGLVAPLGLALILGNLLGSGGGGDPLKLAVADADGGPIAAGFVAQLAAWEDEGHIVLDMTDRSAAGPLIEDHRYAAVFVFPAGFSDAVIAGAPAELTVIGNPELQVATDIAAALATSQADEIGTVQLSVGTVLAASGREPSPETIDELAAEAGSLSTPITFEPFDSGFTGLDYTSYFAAGMTVFFLFFVVQSGVLGLMREREEGTLIRLLAAPIRPASVLLGKVLSSFVLGMASFIVLVIGTTQLVDADWGNAAGVVLLGMAGVVVGVGFVALIVSFSRTEQAARSYAEMVAVVLGLLGGSFFAVGQGSGVAERISWLSPHRWLLEGFMNLNAGDAVVDILPLVGGLLVFAVVTGGIGLLRSRKLVGLS